MVDWVIPPSADTATATPVETLAKQSGVDINKSSVSTQTALSIRTVIPSSTASQTTLSTSKAPTDAISESVTSTIQGINGNLSTSRLTVENAFSSTLGSNTALSQISSALQSVTNTFSKTANQLASNINSSLSKIFDDTNIKEASAVVTKISDPLQTNLTNLKPPLASAFKISSTEAASKPVGINGVNSTFGSKASDMIGVELSTILNRFNIDSPNNLGSKISNNQASSRIKGLLSDVSSIGADISKLTSSVNQASQAVTKSLNVAIRGVQNDLQSFTAKTATLSSLTGIDTSQFFVPSGDTSLRDSSGQLINTRGSRVDRSTANSILDIVRDIGCNVPTELYDSISEIDSLFNALLAAASQFRLDDLVDSLLGCSQAATDSGQAGIIYVFNQTVDSDPVMANKLLGAVSNKSLLSSDNILTNIVSNSELKISDIGTIDSIVTSLGKTMTDPYTVSGISTLGLEVYDLSTISKANDNFTDGVFGDQTFSTLNNATELKLAQEGVFV